MILGIVALALVGLIGYIWVTRGFFSALIHMVCTFLAGAIAFAVWEPVSHAILDASPTTGFMSFLEGASYGLGLAIPFAFSLGILRLIADLSLRANVKVTPTADYVGGGVCGVLAGIPTVGILLISLGFLRLDQQLFGMYQPLEYTSKGMIQRDKGGGMLLPIDAWTNAMYGHMSKASFATETPLATYYPDLAEVPHALRINNNEGAARNVTRPGDFRVLGRFTVGKDKNLDARTLFSDQWNPASQAVSDLDGNTPATGSYIEGFVIRFNSGAKERGGDNKVVFGPSQIRLLCTNAEQTQFKTVYAIAAAAQAESQSPAYARFRFDAKGVFLASVGGTSESSFAVEFAVPPGFSPLALYVKNARHLVSEGATAKPIAFASPLERDAGIVSGALVKFENLGSIKTDTEIKIRSTPRTPIEGVRVTHAVGQTLHKTRIRTLTVDDEGNLITDGEQTFTDAELRDTPLEKALRVERFGVQSDTVMIQVDVSIGTPLSWLGAAAQSVADGDGVMLVDTNNQTYEPVGYIFTDATKSGQRTYRYTPRDPLRKLGDLPTLSRSAPDNKLILLYLVNYGSKIKRFVVGTTGIAEFEPPVEANQRQSGG